MSPPPPHACARMCKKFVKERPAALFKTLRRSGGVGNGCWRIRTRVCTLHDRCTFAQLASSDRASTTPFAKRRRDARRNVGGWMDIRSRPFSPRQHNPVAQCRRRHRTANDERRRRQRRLRAHFFINSPAIAVVSNATNQTHDQRVRSIDNDRARSTTSARDQQRARAINNERSRSTTSARLNTLFSRLRLVVAALNAD